MTGRINSFQSMGAADGPGVRAVVFMQGCPLRCIYCHNPDTWEASGGYETDEVTLAKRILRSKPYFGERGGVTLSGGEVLCQAEFAAALFRIMKKEGVHTALDTSGCIMNDSVRELLSLTDLVLLDYKFTDERQYRDFTGCEKRRVDEFLMYLEENRIPVVIRHVVVPGYTDGEENLVLLEEIVGRYSCITGVELLPFRKLCTEKYISAGIVFPLANTPEATEEQIRQIKKAHPRLDF